MVFRSPYPYKGLSRKPLSGDRIDGIIQTTIWIEAERCDSWELSGSVQDQIEALAAAVPSVGGASSQGQYQWLPKAIRGGPQTLEYSCRHRDPIGTCLLVILGIADREQGFTKPIELVLPHGELFGGALLAQGTAILPACAEAYERCHRCPTSAQPAVSCGAVPGRAASLNDRLPRGGAQLMPPPPFWGPPLLGWTGSHAPSWESLLRMGWSHRIDCGQRPAAELCCRALVPVVLACAPRALAAFVESPGSAPASLRLLLRLVVGAYDLALLAGFVGANE